MQFEVVNTLGLQPGRIVDRFGEVFEGYEELSEVATLDIDETLQPFIQMPEE